MENNVMYYNASLLDTFFGTIYAKAEGREIFVG
jgi:hypothetical protein